MHKILHKNVHIIFISFEKTKYIKNIKTKLKDLHKI